MNSKKRAITWGNPTQTHIQLATVQQLVANGSIQTVILADWARLSQRARELGRIKRQCAKRGERLCCIAEKVPSPRLSGEKRSTG